MNKGRKILKKAASVALGSSMVLTGASIAFAAGSYQETAKTSLDAMVSSVAGAVDDYAQNMDKAFAGSTGKMTLTVEDTGKAVKGMRLDIFFDSHEEAVRYGRQEKYAYLVE